MWINILLILAGLALLYFGGEILITGSVRISRHYRIPPFIVGATVIGFGTSAPELAVSILATLQDAPEMALGNVIGSNIANVALVLGATAFLSPLSIRESLLKKEAPPLLIATFLIMGLVWNMELARWEGLVLISLLAVYLWLAFSKREDSHVEIEEEVKYFSGKGPAFQFLLIIVGLVLLVGGAKWLVEGSVNIARSFGISEWLIGISIVAVGTSLPEIVSSLMAAYRGHGEMSIGNVFGSNIFNILMVLGTTATINPLHIKEPIHFDLWISTGLTCLLLILIRIEHDLSKRDGFILLSCYVTYMTLKSMGVI